MVSFSEEEPKVSNEEIKKNVIDKLSSEMNMSKNEILSYMELTERLAQRPIHSLIDKLYPENGIYIPENGGYVEINLGREFSEGVLILVSCLTLVPHDYEVKIDVPTEEIQKQIWDQYKILIQCAILYWNQFWNSEEGVRLLETLKLTYPPAMYRDAKNNLYLKEYSESELFETKVLGEYRIGLLSYYVGENGEPVHGKELKER